MGRVAARGNRFRCRLRKVICSGSVSESVSTPTSIPIPIATPTECHSFQEDTTGAVHVPLRWQNPSRIAPYIWR